MTFCTKEIGTLKSEGGLPTAELFDELGSYWKEIVEDDFTEKQVSLIKRVIVPDGLVLDLACGTGRHTIHLLNEGYLVVGLDLSHRLLQIAKANAVNSGVNVSLVRADMSYLPFRSKAFASVFSFGSSYGYLPSFGDDLRSFKDVSRSLCSEGVFLIELFNGLRIVRRHRWPLRVGFWRLVSNLLQRFPWLAGLFRWREYPSFLMLQKRGVIDKGTKLFDTWILRDRVSGKIALFRHIARLYNPSILISLLSKSGFQCFRFLGDYDGREFCEHTRRLVVVTNKSRCKL